MQCCSLPSPCSASACREPVTLHYFITETSTIWLVALYFPPPPGPSYPVSNSELCLPLPLCSHKVIIFRFHSKITRCLSFRAWLTSLCIMSCRFICVAINYRVPSSLRLTNICLWTLSSLSIHLSVDKYSLLGKILK